MTVLSPSSCSITCEQIGFQIRALVYSHYVYSTNSGLPAAALSVWCNKQFANPVFTRLRIVFKCHRYHCRLLLWTWKRTSLDENLSQPWNTSAFYHVPQKGPIGCRLVMSYAKLLKLSYLISSSTDMRLTTNHTIKSKETCGNSGLNIKREDEWEFSQCKLFTDRDERCITISLVSSPLRTGG